MSYKLVGLVVIPMGAFLGAFVQLDEDRGRRPRVLDALLFGKQGLEGVSSVTRVGWAGCDLSGAYLGAFVQSFVVDLDCGRGPGAILTTTYQIKVQSVNFM